MKTLTFSNLKARYCHALPAANTLCGIQAANYIVITGIARPSGIAETGERAMPGRRRQKLKIDIKNKPCYQKCGCGSKAYF
jgi:hypothetical protein